MKEKNKSMLIALSVLVLVFGAVIPRFDRNPVIVPRKPGIFINNEAVEIHNLSDSAKERIKESVVLYVGSPAALVNGLPRSIDIINSQAVPIIENNEAYVPVGFIAEALGARVSRDVSDAAMVIESDSYTISFVTGQNKISVNGVQRFLPFPTFSQYGETYIHLPSICEILGRNDYYHSNVIIVSPKNKNMDLNKEKQIVSDLVYYFNSGKSSTALKLLEAANDRGSNDSIIDIPKYKPAEKISLFLNEDELNLCAFPVTQIDPNASVHDHSLIIQNKVVMAPVVLLRFFDIEVFENIKPDVITLLEAAPFGNYASLTMKQGTNSAYLNLQGQDPYVDAEKYKDSLVTLPAAPRFMNNHLYIPIVEVSRLLGIKAAWDQRSYAVKIKSMGAPRFPNLSWVPYIIDRTKADYAIKMTIRFVDTTGNMSSGMDYTSSGYYDSGEYAGEATIRTSADSSSSFNTETKYQVKRYLNKTMGYEYSVKDLKDQLSTTGTFSTMENGEILMTDVEYIKGEISLLAGHFYASDLLKKQYNVKVNNQMVDKYSIVLNDRPSIEELFEIKKLPRIDILKPLYEGSVYVPDAEAYVFKNFKMELSVNKSGQIINCSIFYSGYKKNERAISPRDIEGYPSTEKMDSKWNTPFEVSIEADFSNFK